MICDLDNRVNLSKIAKDLGLSVSTVSRALSGSGRISETTTQTIKDYLKDKQLTPNVRKQGYNYIKNNVIAITMPDDEETFQMPYFQTILSSVYDYFSIRDYQVIIIKTGFDSVDNLEHAILNHAMDGVIISRQIDQYNEIELLNEYEVPFVLIGRDEHDEIPQIELDIENACFDLTNTLVKTGCRKIAVLGNNRKHPVNQKRINGIKRACMKNYIVLNPEYVFWDTDSDSIVEMAVEKILMGNVDCVLCMDDDICLKTLCVIQRLQKKIPEDISIASLHNSAVLDRWNPPVTCIRYDVHMLGREAGKMLYAHLTEKKDVKHIRLGYEIKLRESTKTNINL